MPNTMKYVHLTKFDEYLSWGNPAAFVPTPSVDSVLERVPLGNHKLALMNRYTDCLSFSGGEPAGFTRPGPQGGTSIFVEFENEDGSVSLMLSAFGAPDRFVSSWRGKPGVADAYPLLFLASDRVGPDQKFRYVAPRGDLLPNGRNEEVYDNTGDLPASKARVFTKATDRSSQATVVRSHPATHDILEEPEDARWNTGFEH